MPKGRPPSGIQPAEVLVEVGCDGTEDGLVARLLLLAQLRDQVVEVCPRGGDVLELRGQVLIPFLELSALGFSERVGRPDLLQSALERAHLALTRFAAGHLLGGHPVGHARTDLVHAGLQQLSLARDELEVAL